jgi:D-inositol-3-phosphate glycosyltransferase
MIAQVAMLCLHSSPLDQPGAGNGGGMNVYVRELARALAARDIAVDIFTRSVDGLRVVEDAPGVRVICVPAGPRGSVAKGDLADLAPALLHGIHAWTQQEAAQYDLIHSHYWISGLVGQHLARAWSVPHVQMFHTFSRIKTAHGGASPDPRRARAEARLLEEADAVVVTNAVERLQVLEQYGPPPTPLVTIPCGIDPAPFAEARDSTPRGADGRIVVAALGRLERLKNFSLLLRGTALACAQDSRFAEAVEVRIAGGPSGDEPETIDELRRSAGELGIEDRVRFLGAMPRERIASFYAAADLCVVPSRHESFGLVALEAMAAGLPVVATRTGGLQATVVEGSTGYLIGQDEPAALADRLLLLQASPSLRRAMGAAGAHAAQHYAWPRVAERICCLYDALCSTRSASTAS